MVNSKLVRCVLKRGERLSPGTVWVRLILAAIVAATAVAPSAAQESESPPDAAPQSAPGQNTPGLTRSLVLGAGDVVAISVWREPDVSAGSLVVRADGKITLPLIKEVFVAGLTPSQVEQTLEDKFSEFIRDPDVTVMVQQIKSQRVFVYGGVSRPGFVDLVGDMTVLEALAMAGGLSDYAKKKKIYVIREQDGQKVTLPYDYVGVISGENVEADFVLRPGDTIVVPQ